MRLLTAALAAAVAVSACGRDRQDADTQPAVPPAAVLDTTVASVDGVVDTTGALPGTQPADGPGQSVKPGPQSPAAGAPAAGQPGQQPAAQRPALASPSQPAQSATQAADGAAILRRASAAYENVRSVRSDFVMNMQNPLLRLNVTSRGTLYQRQPDRIALRFVDPDGDVIIGDGQYFWIYYPSNDPQQVIRSPSGAAGESGVNLQAQFVGNPVDRFDYTVEGTESVSGRRAHVLTLVPRQRSEYRSLKVWLDEQDSLARRFEITEHNGSVRRFDLQNMQVNASIPDAVFRFTPPEGARVISGG
ncbi:hypothetical protein BH23GEM9_BH23GEM9_27290 [soil metagenome]